MSRLLRLYPRAWRGRYGAELASILEARPATFMDRVDLIRGAVDAHLHPELVARNGEARQARDPASGSVLSGLLIVLGSALWLVGVTTIAIQPLGFGDRESDALGPFVAIAGLLYAGAILRLVWSGGIRGRIGSGVIAAFAVTVLPMVWPISVFGFYGLMISLAVTALNRAVAGRWPGWLAATISVAAVLAFGTNTESGSMWLATLPAFAMAFLGVLSVFGRLPTGPERGFEAEGATA
jgi:hypothetical protein